ncbi:hypothetical protein Ocin01_08670 [Orchesella cincta]|uniref:Uncharacterized protein n=1 Tax=Orchesella cincta TaxID=48709 RepID=A0A1D2MYE1_ORCCI|nr:hypothetical protein Ocin01_08670 [Orchesella cincta]
MTVDPAERHPTICNPLKYESECSSCTSDSVSLLILNRFRFLLVTTSDLGGVATNGNDSTPCCCCCGVLDDLVDFSTFSWNVGLRGDERFSGVDTDGGTAKRDGLTSCSNNSDGLPSDSPNPSKHPHKT